VKILGSPGGPYVVVEPADNIGGGAPGDSTSVLRAFLRHGVENCAVAIADPDCVRSDRGRQARRQVRTLSIGGKGSRARPRDRSSSKATFVSAQRRRLRTRGPATATSRHRRASRLQHGAERSWSQANGVTILLSSRKTPPFDLGQLRSQGIIPEDLSVIGVKAAVAHRRAYDKIAKGSYTVTTPGPCTSALKTLPYQRLRKPVFPIS
jgi:microcystin degradation protein MlrC